MVDEQITLLWRGFDLEITLKFWTLAKRDMTCHVAGNVTRRIMRHIRYPDALTELMVGIYI